MSASYGGGLIARVELADAHASYFEGEAALRGLTVSELIAALLGAIAEGDLIDAVQEAAL